MAGEELAAIHNQSLKNLSDDETRKLWRWASRKTTDKTIRQEARNTITRWLDKIREARPECDRRSKTYRESQMSQMSQSRDGDAWDSSGGLQEEMMGRINGKMDDAAFERKQEQCQQVLAPQPQPSALSLSECLK